MKAFYGTTLDAKFVVPSLTLYNSLIQNSPNKLFGFFCMDDDAAVALERLNLPQAWVVRREEFETTELLAVRPSRQLNEYCWTCKPAVISYAFKRDPTITWGVYLDSDMAAFGDPDQALPSDPSVKAVISPHRYSLPKFEKFGPIAGWHNGGYAAFRNDFDGTDIVDWWQARCLEDCPAVPNAGRYADQKYLDSLPALYEGVVSSPLKGLNTAPWNIDSYRISDRGGNIFVDDDELLIYHFQSLKIFGRWLVDCYAGPHELPKDAITCIYRRYLQNIRVAYAMVRSVKSDIPLGAHPFLTAPKTIYHQLVRWRRGTSNLVAF
jgi:hypothetical protein